MFKSEFVGQTRGFSPLNAVIEDLKCLDDYSVAELMAAKIGAVMALVYERNGQAQAGDFLDNADGIDDDPGSFAQELSPGMTTICPTGYGLKSISSNHPHNGYSEFNKAILKRVASSLGCSYNRLLHDYESVNFSSLRDAAIDEKILFNDIQGWMIRNWKERQFRLFIENQAISGDMPSSKLLEARRYHHFLAQKKPYFDPGKEVQIGRAHV